MPTVADRALQRTTAKVLSGAPLSHCYPKRFCYRPILDSTSQPSPSLSAHLKFPPPYHLAHNSFVKCPLAKTVERVRDGGKRSSWWLFFALPVVFDCALKRKLPPW